MRAQGAGEQQNVNQSVNAVHLRFDVQHRPCRRPSRRACWRAARPSHHRRRRGRHQGTEPSQPGHEPRRRRSACRSWSIRSKAAARAPRHEADLRLQAAAARRQERPLRDQGRSWQSHGMTAAPGLLVLRQRPEGTRPTNPPAPVRDDRGQPARRPRGKHHLCALRSATNCASCTRSGEWPGSRCTPASSTTWRWRRTR